MASFYKVIGNGCVLNWPLSIEQNHPPRGRKGYVVDLDAPLEREWCAGQEYKITPAPEATAANPITHPMAVRQIAAHAKAAAQKPASSSESPADADLEVKPRGRAKASA